MGQRVNYIIKENNNLSIFYHHWRAVNVTADLYLGETKFMEFVKDCKHVDVIMENPWIEGCVLIDKDNKELSFWTFHMSIDTSIVNFYLEELSKKWINWKIRHLKREMYDIDEILNIGYISNQKISERDLISEEEIISDKVESEWFSTLIIIKEEESLFITKTGSLDIWKIISYGQCIVPLLFKKPQYQLPKEGDDGAYHCVMIDIDNKKVFFNDCILGLVENCKFLWEDYKLIHKNFGYIEMLNCINVDTKNLLLSESEVEEQFFEMIKDNSDFDPFEIANKIIKENDNVKFNENFFDNVKPVKSFLSKLKNKIKRVFRM